MPRPLTSAAQAENRAFLATLAQTGNARLAARQLGLNRSALTKRRARHAAFAQQWEAALAAAHARFKLGGGTRVPEPAAPRTRGGEPSVVRLKNGKLQLRLALPGQITRAAEQAFLRALSASANVRLSAAAAGLSHSTVYRHKAANAGFARELRAALEIGYDRLRLASLQAANPDYDRYDEWIATGELPPLPRASFSQALQLLAVHRNGVRLGFDAPHRRKRRNETHAQYGQRLALMWLAEQRNLDHERAAARGRRYEESGSWRLAGDWPEVTPLPDLNAVTKLVERRKLRAAGIKPPRIKRTKTVHELLHPPEWRATGPWGGMTGEEASEEARRRRL